MSLDNRSETRIAEGQVDSMEAGERQEDNLFVQDLLAGQSHEEVARIYEDTLRNFVPGEVVRGRVVSVSDDKVLVDISYKSEGIIARNEFPTDIEISVDDEFDVFIEETEGEEGMPVLSKTKADRIKNWTKVQRAYDGDDVVKGQIVRRVKGGLKVDVSGLDSFLPASQIASRPAGDLDRFIGETWEFKVIKLSRRRRNIVLSRRKLIEEEQAVEKEKLLSTLEVGKTIEGEVKNITDFGAFVDVGGIDGLLHVSDMSWGRVRHPSDAVKVGQALEVKVLSFDKETERISLGLKQKIPNPWIGVEDKYPVGSTVTGRVVSMTDYGAFVELEEGVEGMVHVSEMSWSQHIKNPAQLLKEGEKVEAVVLSIETDDRKISLGLKQLTPDPWDKIEEKYPIDSKHNGIVRNLTPFGAFVELEEGVDGLVHISDLSWTKKVRHPSEVVKKNQEIEVVVLDINKEERRIALGHKQVETNPWDTFEETYNVGIETTGKISRLIDKGVIVTLPLGVDSFVPLNHLGRSGLKRASDHFKVGDELPLKVIEFDKENKRIVLSVSEYLKGKEKQEIDAYNTAHNFSPTTMGELVKDVPEVLEGLPGEEKDRGRPAKKPKSKKSAEEKESEPEAVVSEETETVAKETEPKAEKSEEESVEVVEQETEQPTAVPEEEVSVAEEKEVEDTEGKKAAATKKKAKAASATKKTKAKKEESSKEEPKKATKTKSKTKKKSDE